jgi:hypothetical protein
MTTFFRFLCATLAIFSTPAWAQVNVALPDISVIKLQWDQKRAKLYGLNPGYGLMPGTLIAFNPTNGIRLAEIPLGTTATDMALTSDGQAIYVINTGSRTIMKVNLDTFAVTSTRSFGTPDTYDPANPLHITAGRSNLVYFTDGGWSPGIYTFNFDSGEVLSNFDDDSGAGGLLTTRDGNTLFIWRQYGWGAGSVSSWVTRLDARSNTLTPVQDSFNSWRRDPFDTPLLLNADESVLFNKQQMFLATNIAVLLREFPENIYSISRRGDLAFGNSKVFSAWSGEQLASLPFSSTVQTVTAEDQVLACYHSQPSELVLVPFSTLLGAGWETNKPPVAAFSRTPTNSSTMTLIAFDGGLSTDDQGGGAALQYRWDWQNDGQFDTDFTNSPTVSFKYNMAGTKTAALQVKDRYGAVSTATQTFDVVQEDDPGIPGGGNVLFEVQFPAADIAFNPVRAYAYVTGFEKKTLAILNLTNGLIERQFNFDFYAESMAISPDAHRLYVALLRRPHQYYGSGGHTNYIAEFNLATATKVREFMIDADPSDLAVTDSGIIIVPGGSDQWTDIRTYRVGTGAFLGSRSIRHMSRMSLHPGETSVYTADTDLSPSDVQHYTFDPVTGAFLSGWDSPYHGDYPMSGGVWCSPLGTNVVTRGGTVLTSSPDQSQDLRYYRTLAGGLVEEAAFDLPHQAMFTVGNNKLCYYNLKTLELVAEQSVSNNTRYIFTTPSHVFMASTDSGKTVFQRLPNPAAGAETNTTPKAAFAYTPTNATSLKVLTFDANLSTDDHGGGIALLYRWDWESDGTFDTVFTNEPVAMHRFNIPGTKTVTLQVKDRYGAMGTAVQTINVIQEDDAGSPGENNPAFEIQFGASDVAFDPLRPFAFVTSMATKQLVMINLTNGFIDRQFTFDYMPESIAISPNGAKMYVALLTRPHDYYWWEESPGHVGYIAEFDLATRVKTRDFMINEDPYDLAVTDSGILIVPGGSGQWTSIRSYRTSTGELLGSSGIRQMSHIRLHPSQRAVYTADTDSSPSDIRRYDFDPSTGAFLSSWDSPYHGDYAMNGDVWCHPSGSYVFARGGGLFTSSPVQAQDMRFVQNLPGGAAMDIAFDNAHNAVFAIGNGKLWHYNMTNLQLVTSQPITNEARYVHAADRTIYIASTTGDRTYFQRLQNPALPEPTILEQPLSQQVTVGASVFLNVTASGASPLMYQWYVDNAAVTNGNTSSLLLSNIRANQAGNYFVVVSNAYGFPTSRVATVTVLVPPTITQAPQNVTAVAGSVAQMSVQAGGTAPLRYQWTFEGANLVGQTNSTLAITNVQARHDGVYRVSVQNVLGGVTSPSAILRVVPVVPVILEGPASVSVQAGSNALFTASVRGTEPFTYQWEFAGQPLPGATLSSLLIQNAQANHAGAYAVRVTNGAGSALSGAALLTVSPAAPWFVRQPESWTGPAGNIVLLSPLVRGSEPLDYEWRWNGTSLPTATTANLTLTNANAAQSGSYVLVATNSLGAATSLVATVVITSAPPVFVVQPTDISVALAGTINLATLASGSEPVAYRWFAFGTNLPGKTARFLNISNATAANSGPYFAIASNAFGMATSSVANVIVRVPPQFRAPVSNLVADTGTDLQWTFAVQGAGPMAYSWSFQGTALPGATSATLLITNLQPRQSGVYSLTASNLFGTASLSAFLKVFPRPGDLIAWGDNAGGQSDLPALTNIVDIAGGDFHSLALRHNGTLAAWGFDGDGQASVPTNFSPVIAIAAGAAHNLALRLDGSLRAWGRNDAGQTIIPGGLKPAVAIAAGETHSVAVLEDGFVAVWGDNSLGQRNIPYSLGFITAVAAGRSHTVALRNNGTVTAWGFNQTGQSSPPPGLSDIKAVAAGYLHSLALRQNGSVVAWGDNTWGQTSVPPGLTNVVAIAAGELHSLALLATGEVVAWGDDSFGQLEILAPGRTLVAVSAGYYHNLAVAEPLVPLLNFQPIAQNMLLWWDAKYRLQSAPSPNGPFQDMDVNSPYTNDCRTAPMRFFRLRSGN